MSMPVHRFETVDDIRWHWAEMGDGDPVVLLHGIPESWLCWKHQMPTLATQFRVLTFDLKGYGRSEKADGDYTGNGVARELLACLDKIGIERFRLAGHDWGVIVGDHIVNQAPDRVERYMRCCLSLHTYDVRNSLHHQWNGENPQAATRLPDDVPAGLRETLLGRHRGRGRNRRHHHSAEHPVHPVRDLHRHLLAPIAHGLGVDPFHFAVIFLIGDSIGFITPPYGLNLYVASGITGLPYFRIVRQVIPYLFSLLIVWGIVAMVPDLSTWLVKFAGLGGAGLTLN